jgi:hypothetical protein
MVVVVRNIGACGFCGKVCFSRLQPIPDPYSVRLN